MSGYVPICCACIDEMHAFGILHRPRQLHRQGERMKLYPEAECMFCKAITRAGYTVDEDTADVRHGTGKIERWWCEKHEQDSCTCAVLVTHGP